MDDPQKLKFARVIYSIHDLASEDVKGKDAEQRLKTISSIVERLHPETGEVIDRSWRSPQFWKDAEAELESALVKDDVAQPPLN